MENNINNIIKGKYKSKVVIYLADSVCNLAHEGRTIITRKDIVGGVKELKGNKSSYLREFNILEKEGLLTRLENNDSRAIKYQININNIESATKENIDVDMDNVFKNLDSDLKAVIHKVKFVNEYKKNVDDKIAMLERDRDMYREKCHEYRNQILHLQERINFLKNC